MFARPSAPSSARRSTRLPACVLAALALHAGAIGWLGSTAWDGHTGSGGLGAAGAAGSGRDARGSLALPGQPAAVAGRSPALTVRWLPAPPAHDPAPVQASITAAAQPPAAAPPAPAHSPAPGAAEDGYVARPHLTTAPRALADIALPFPLDFTTRGRFAGILTLYIEADGRVSRVMVEGDSLPPPLARVAERAFAAARFAPGQVQQRIVKSRLRVEVVFDNETA